MDEFSRFSAWFFSSRCYSPVLGFFRSRSIFGKTCAMFPVSSLSISQWPLILPWLYLHLKEHHFQGNVCLRHIAPSFFSVYVRPWTLIAGAATDAVPYLKTYSSHQKAWIFARFGSTTSLICCLTLNDKYKISYLLVLPKIDLHVMRKKKTHRIVEAAIFILTLLQMTLHKRWSCKLIKQWIAVTGNQVKERLWKTSDKKHRTTNEWLPRPKLRFFLHNRISQKAMSQSLWKPAV